MASSYPNRSRSDSSRTSDPVPENSAEVHSYALSLTVLFTTTSGTLAALRETAHWAHQLGACIRILVAHVVPYPLPIDQPCVDPKFRLRHFRTLCEQSPVETCIEIHLCRDAHQCIQEVLPPHSLIVIGSGPSRWPLAYEKRLGRKLRKAGHQVVFVRSSGSGGREKRGLWRSKRCLDRVEMRGTSKHER